MPNDLAPDPTHTDAARLFRYDEPCPRCGKATRYKVFADSTERQLWLTCTACEWGNRRC